MKAVSYSAIGAAVVLVIGYVVYINQLGTLDVWHLSKLDEEFTIESQVNSFEDYLALEARLFKQLDEQVYASLPAAQGRDINRYSRGSLSDPARWSTNWNRSFVLPSKSPRASVLLLHGMSDSPYSLRALGEQLNASGVYVLGLRLPGHGTAPSGLVEITWQDMAAAVRLAMRHLARNNPDQPIYIVGYSNGAALAVQYALETLQDATQPRVDRLVLLSPAIGVSRVAVLAVWQARLGHLLGLENLAWTDILPEYDSFKYNSFAVNAGDVVYQLTNEIQQQITVLAADGKMADFPPVLAFSSVVDATVSTPALVQGLFERLPPGKHELVLFGINRIVNYQPLMKWDSSEIVQALRADPHRAFTLSHVTNIDMHSRGVVVRTQHPDVDVPVETNLGLSWPNNIYSLAHVALPFPPEDRLYGGYPAGENPGIRLGDIALRGERGTLQVSAADMLRLRWNPFYPYVEMRVLEFFDLSDP